MFKKSKLGPQSAFLFPGIFLYTCFVILPIFYGFYIALHQWSGLGDMEFVGVDNFKTLIFNPRISRVFWNAVKNNFKYLLVIWFFITPIQFLMAYYFYEKIPFFRYHKFMIFLPYVFSSAIVGFFATMIFDPTIGFLNNFFEQIGMTQLTDAWIGNPNRSFKILSLIVLWQSAGSGVLIFYANMLNIPGEIIDASRVDGCTGIQRFFKVILPVTLPSSSSVIVMSSIWALGIFDLPFMLGGSTGGVNGSLDFANLVFYRYTFGNVLSGETNLGFGASISIAVFIMMILVTSILNRFLSKFDYDY